MTITAACLVALTACIPPPPYAVTPAPIQRPAVPEAADPTTGLAETIYIAGLPRPKPASRAVRAKPARSRERTPVKSRGACDLDTIKRLESNNNYSAQNRRSTASGAYQVLDSTWNGYAGYRRSKDAPPEVQDRFAAELYARRGSQPWVVCR